MRKKLLFLCTCTGLEIMTSFGVIMYLLLLEKPILALISCVIFGKLIVFHFVMEYFDKKLPISKKEISM